ncbi:hypothetical protein H4R33_000865 [Dimargaris cristalligena]|uniref:t-SNARE n=1 Tax=Dimargaris cristalligena TaxID=215637 RepID=A0A4P9ZX07_9FUNG|nr:hypothetical protein H4R33_000865 [Dimargaris cristalligena]RKP38215.1 t-SNARE [Dimargaris cristalligena]|eukprot:RKP38215.1 t-SNARE [Dimargaris cristalligena]
MSRDRLGEFRAEAQPGDGYYPAPASLEMGNLNPAGSDPSGFHEQIRGIEQELEAIQQQVDQVDRLNQRTLQAVGEDQSNRCRQERDQVSTEIDQLIRRAQGGLEELTTENQRLPVGAPDTAARKGRTAAVTRRFQEVIERYRELEDVYWNKSRDRLKRQYKVAKPLATDEEIEQALDDERAGQVFTQSLLSSTRVGDARRVMREVETRQLEMRQIEKKALELNALFVRLNEMVHAQQEVIDNIEVQVGNTVTDTAAANEQVEKAISIRKRTRKKLWILTIIVILIIIAIVLAVVFSVK